MKVLNIDTNVIQPLTLESIANGTSVNEALQELRCNNTANGRLVTEAFLRALKSNPSLCKLGYPVTDAYFRGEIDKQLTRNNDAARKRRLEEKRRKEAGEAESEAAETKGYPHPPKADQQPERSPERIKEVKETVKEVLEVKEVITKKQELEEAPQLPEAEPAMLSEAGPTTETSPELKEAAVEPAEPCQAEAEPSPVAEDELKEPQAMTEEPCDEPERAGSSLKEARSKVSASDCEHARTDIPGTIEAFLGEGSKTSVDDSVWPLHYFCLNPILLAPAGVAEAPLPMRNLRNFDCTWCGMCATENAFSADWLGGFLKWPLL